MAAVLAVAATGTAAATQAIGSCDTLATPSETYVLQNDIDASGGDCLTIAADDVTIQGNGHLIYNTNAGVFHENGNDGLEVVDLRVADGNEGLEMDVGSDAVLRNVRTNATVNDGVEADDSAGLTVLDSNLTASSDAIDYDAGTGEIRVENSTLLGDGGGDVMDLDDDLLGMDIIIEDSILGQTGEGVDLGCCGTLLQDGSVTIRRTTFRDLSSEAIELDGFERVAVTIENNVFEPSEYDPFLEVDDFANTSLVFSGNVGNSTNGDGFDLDDLDTNVSVTIANNDVEVDDDVIDDLDDIEDGSSAVVRNNRLISTGTGCCDDGLETDDVKEDSSLSVIDNTIRAEGDGIKVDDVENGSVTVDGNTVNATDEEGIELDDLDPGVTLTVTSNDVEADDDAFSMDDFGDWSSPDPRTSGVIRGNDFLSYGSNDRGLYVEDIGQEVQLEVSGNDAEGEDEGIDISYLYDNATVTVTGNDAFSMEDYGGEFGDMDQGGTPELTVSGNTFETNDSNTQAVEMDFIEDGPLTFQRNLVLGGEHALEIDSTSNPPLIDASFNVFRADVNGVENANTSSGATLDARENYWNASDGPGSSPTQADIVTGALANGNGSNVSDGNVGGASNVRFDPYLSSNPLTDDFVGGGPANENPVASMTVAPEEPAVGETITFNASDSYDPDGTVDRYYWAVDGEGQFQFAEEQTVSQTFSEEGIYEIELFVEDDGGDTAKATRSLVVGSEDAEQTQALQPPSEENTTEDQMETVAMEEDETTEDEQDEQTEQLDDTSTGQDDEDEASDDGGSDADTVESPDDGEGEDGTGGEDGEGGPGSMPVMIGAIAVIGAGAAAVFLLRG